MFRSVHYTRLLYDMFILHRTSWSRAAGKIWAGCAPGWCSGVNRGQIERKGSFRGYPKKGVVRCSLELPGNLPLKLPSFNAALY